MSTPTHFAPRSSRASSQRGLSLVELMVAMVIGLFLIGGAIKVYVDSRATFATDEAVARLQETARYSMSVLESDIRMANSWGLIKDAMAVVGDAKPTDAASGLVTGTGANNCINNFAVNAERFLEGTDNLYGFNVSPVVSGSTNCDPSPGAAVATADTITVRRVTAASMATAATTLQVCSTRLAATIMKGATCAAAPNGSINDLIVNTYYVDSQSDQSTTYPSLRRKSLIAGPTFTDVEIMPGVEDMQVQFGWDQTGGEFMQDAAGAIIPPGTVTRYVDADNIPTTGQIVAVRFWLLIRAEAPEIGFTNSATYSYGDRTGAATATLTAGAAYAPADGFRRLLVSRTIFIRNAVGT